MKIRLGRRGGGGGRRGSMTEGQSLLLICYVLLLQVRREGDAINIVSPFSFNILVVPIKLPIEIGSSLGSLVALGAIVVAKLALVTTLHKTDDLGESYHVLDPHGKDYLHHGGKDWNRIGPLPHYREWNHHRSKERRRRHIQGISPKSLQRILDSKEERLLWSLYKRDTQGCLSKFLCQLGSISDRSSLGLEEQLILTLFQQKDWRPESFLPSSVFRDAIYAGETNLLGTDFCRKRYPRCIFTSAQMMSFYRRLRPAGRFLS